MTKIGIITFHRAHNYGAVLQAYALQSYLKSLGHDVSFVDYRCREIEKLYKLFYWRRHFFKSIARTMRLNYVFIQKFSDRRKRMRAFDQFITNYFSLTPLNEASQLDYCVLGSDQIWNPKLTGGYNDIYWGTFLKDSPTRVISYAASMEVQAISPKNQEEVKRRLEVLSAISVREELLQKLLSPFTQKRIEVTIDPTLLVDRSVWDNIASRPDYMPQNYVLLYIVKRCEEVKAYARQVAKERGAVLVELESELRETARPHLYSAESPAAYVAWFKYASCVFTTSFHGTAFSLIFNKEFYVYNPPSITNSRVQSLLMGAGVPERQYAYDTPPMCAEIDYTIVNKNLDAMRESSRAFLANNITK